MMSAHEVGEIYNTVMRNFCRDVSGETLELVAKQDEAIGGLNK
jgi:hypothetical protein